MAGTNAGTGYRIHARCFWCARIRNGRARGYRLTILGREAKEKRGGIRIDTDYRYRVRCDDCGMEGWTRHLDIARRYAAQQQPA